MLVGRAVRQRPIDVDVGGAGTAVLFAVHEVGVFVDVARDLEKEIAEALVDRELHIAETGYEERSVGVEGEAVGGPAKSGAGLGDVEAVAGHIERFEEIRAGGVKGDIACVGIGVAADGRGWIRAAAERDRIVLVTGDTVKAVVGIIDVVVRTAPRDAGGLEGVERGRARAIQGCGRGERGLAVPAE